MNKINQETDTECITDLGRMKLFRERERESRSIKEKEKFWYYLSQTAGGTGKLNNKTFFSDSENSEARKKGLTNLPSEWWMMMQSVSDDCSQVFKFPLGPVYQVTSHPLYFSLLSLPSLSLLYSILSFWEKWYKNWKGKLLQLRRERRC